MAGVAPTWHAGSMAETIDMDTLAQISPTERLALIGEILGMLVEDVGERELPDELKALVRRVAEAFREYQETGVGRSAALDALDSLRRII